MLFYIIQTNFVSITIILFLYIFLMTNHSQNKEITRMFLAATIVANILVMADALDYYYASFSKLSELRYIIRATGYTFRPAGLLIFIFNLKKMKRSHRVFLLIPFFINMVLAYSSIFTHVMFYFDEANRFYRGPVGMFPFIISGYYILVMTSLAAQKHMIGDKREAAVVLWVAIMLTASVVMESIYHFWFITSGVALVSIVFYYLFLHTQAYKRDAMTNTLNRHAFYADVDKFKEFPMIVVSIDINDLKKVNDTQGHAAGDTMIQTVANGIMERLKSGLFLYRTGGDEFVLLGVKKQESDMVKMMEQIEEKLTRKNYKIAWGVAQYMPDMEFNKVMSLSDERMYERKKQMKETPIR